MEPTFEQELEVLIRARYPLLYVVSSEERRAEEILRGLAHRLSKRIYFWSLTRGYEPPLAGSAQEEPTRTKLAPEIEALVGLFRHEQDALYVLKDFHPFLGDARTVRLLRDLAPRLHSSGRTLVLLSPLLKLPPELEKEMTVVEMPLPTREEIAQRLREILLQVRDKPGVQAEVSAQELDELVQAAQGLTMDEIENVCARSFVEHRKLTVAAILSEKQQIVRKSGVLEYYTPSETMADVGGLDLLKEWLRKRRSAFSQPAREFGLPAPKGVLLLGVQGTGKSLSAKAIASLWNLPMLRLDVGRVFGSLVGASEANMRLAIRTAEAIAPCILWIDELEKGFSGVQSSGMSDSGTTARVFATFLTWMQEKRKPVFVVATANEASLLPPELLRKGRFDEIFFIDLPSAAEREQIFAIHLRKRKRDPEQFDLKALAHATEGFSGAEIEQVVIGALFTAFDAGRDLTQEDLMHEIKSMVPLSVMMREEIDELRTWAQMRTRPASSRAPARKRNRI